MLYPEPDYDSYSLASLLEAQKNIDRGLYPERAQKIDRMVEERKAAGHVPNPQAKTGRPIGAWLILIYCGFGALTTTLIVLLSASIDPKTLPAEYAGKSPFVPMLLLIPFFMRSMVALAAAIFMVNYRRVATRLFLVAAILALLTMPISALRNHDAFQILMAALGSVLNAAIMAWFCIYARNLENKGILKN